MGKNGVGRMKSGGAVDWDGVTDVICGVRIIFGITYVLYMVVRVSLLGKAALEQRLNEDEGQTSGKSVSGQGNGLWKDPEGVFLVYARNGKESRVTGTERVRSGVSHRSSRSQLKGLESCVRT